MLPHTLSQSACAVTGTEEDVLCLLQNAGVTVYSHKIVPFHRDIPTPMFIDYHVQLFEYLASLMYR